MKNMTIFLLTAALSCVCCFSALAAWSGYMAEVNARYNGLHSGQESATCFEKLLSLSPNTLIEVKPRGQDTKNPVDDFMAFANECGFVDMEPLPPSGRIKVEYEDGLNQSMYFVLLMKTEKKFLLLSDDKYGDLKAMMHESGTGELSPYYFKIGADQNLYIVRIDNNLKYFLDSLFNPVQSEIEGGNPAPYCPLKTDLGERIFFVPSGELPYLAFIQWQDSPDPQEMENNPRFNGRYAPVALDSFRSRSAFDLLVRQSAPREFSGYQYRTAWFSLWSDSGQRLRFESDGTFFPALIHK
jgi:hypothetical protein